MNLKERIEQLQAGETPNYIFPFFWQHHEEESVLREYMNAIYHANIRAVCVESRPHPDFVGPLWWQDMDIILEEATRLGMQVWILDDMHFPTGYAAGAIEQAPEQMCHQYLDYNTVDVCGPKPAVQLHVEPFAHPQPTPPWMPPQPAPKRIFHDDQLFKVLAYRIVENGLLADMIDLTYEVKDGWLAWDVPTGYWKIFIVYLTRNAKGRNDYINFLDMDSCRLFIDTVYEPHYTHYKHLFGSVIAGFFSDEPPIGNTPGYTHGDLIGKPDMSLPWSTAMFEQMEIEFGSDWALHIPMLWVKGKDHQRTAHIRTSYMNAVTKLVSACFSNQIGNWCQDHGVEYIGHMVEDCDSSSNLGPSMGHFFRGLSGQHMAGIDNIGGQVLIGGQHVYRHANNADYDEAGFYHYNLGRLGASMAAIDPRKQGRCMCENFGAYGWQIGVRTEKYLTDHFLARGVNRFVPHAFSPKAFPDPDCPPHFYAHGENPQYHAFGKLMEYTNRVSHLVDGGQCVTPVALLYHGEGMWAGAAESNIHACRELTRHQIGFTILPSDVFEKPLEYHTSFDSEHGTLQVNGITFHTLVVSGCDFITTSVARFIAENSSDKFPVIFTGQLPIGISDSDNYDSNILIRNIQNCPVTPVKELAPMLDSFIKRDAVLDYEFPDMTIYHYLNKDDLYILLNENPSETYEGNLSLPSIGNAVEYDAWWNKLTPLKSHSNHETTMLPIKLLPLEMKIIVVGNQLPVSESNDTQMQTENKIELLEFTVSRCNAKEYPNFSSVEPADLKNGMGFLHPDFSGYYRYEANFDLATAATNVELCMKDVYESAEVFINGHSAGLITAPPYRYPIGHLLQAGDNSIAIEVATTLERKAAAMGVDVACMNVPSPYSPVGILGPVTILF
jgi:hypothetical protein